MSELNSGDTAWMLISTVLVLLMTIPGLSLFYAGMVRLKFTDPVGASGDVRRFGRIHVTLPVPL